MTNKESEEILNKWGISDALFIDGKAVRTGPPPSYDKIMRKIHGTTMKHFRKGELKSNYLPHPPINEQILISNIFRNIDKKIINEQNYLKSLKTIKKNLMQDLLTGKKRTRIK